MCDIKKFCKLLDEIYIRENLGFIVFTKCRRVIIRQQQDELYELIEYLTEIIKILKNQYLQNAIHYKSRIISDEIIKNSEMILASLNKYKHINALQKVGK